MLLLKRPYLTIAVLGLSLKEVFVSFGNFVGQSAVQFCKLTTFKDPEIEKYLLVLSWLIMSKVQIGTMNHLNVLYVRAKLCVQRIFGD